MATRPKLALGYVADWIAAMVVSPGSGVETGRARVGKAGCATASAAGGHGRNQRLCYQLGSWQVQEGLA